MAFPHDGRKFPPGQSGNPAGMKPGTTHLATRIRALLEGDDPLPAAILKTIKDAVGADKKPLDAMIIAGLLQALQGDAAWAKLLAEQGYGKAVQPTENKTELTGSNGGPLQVDAGTLAEAMKAFKTGI